MMDLNPADLLLAYSEWLDSQGLVVSDHGPGADKRSHSDLAGEFVGQWTLAAETDSSGIALDMRGGGAQP